MSTDTAVFFVWPKKRGGQKQSQIYFIFLKDVFGFPNLYSKENYIIRSADYEQRMDPLLFG